MARPGPGHRTQRVVAVGRVVSNLLVRHLAALPGCSPLHQPAQAALRLAPWVWPKPDAPGLDACLRRAVELPELRPGDAPLLTVHDHQTSLWLHRFDLDSHPVLHFAQAGADTVCVVARARSALTRTARLFWGPEPWQHGDTLVMIRLDARAAPRRTVEDLGLDGQSVGLGMYLSLASQACGVAPCPRTIALAGVDEHGRVTSVQRLGQKLRDLDELAPRLDRVLVCLDQLATAKSVAPPGRFELVGVDTVDQAADLVLDDDRVARSLIRAGSQPHRRARIIRQLFTQALLGRSQVYHWGPVKQAADLALGQWPELAPDDIGRLATVRMVAGRYAKEPHAQRPPSDAWLSQLPLHTRAAVLAHLLQQIHDFGLDLEDERAAEVEATLVQVGDSMPGVRLRGARARLWARDGQPERAMAEQRTLAQLVIELLQPSSATHGLAEWLRLAGALSPADEDEVDAALAFEDELEDHDGLSTDSRPYVDLSAGRALALLGRTDDARKRLYDVVHGPEVPGRTVLLASAWRWLAFCGVTRARDQLSAMPAVLQLEDERRAVRAVQQLVALDRGEHDATTCAAAMEARWSTLARRILSGAPEGIDRGRWLQRLWPY